MTTAFISDKIRYNNAEQFKASFSASCGPSIGYVFIGKHVPYADDNVPEEIISSDFSEKSIWDNMIAAKRVVGNSVELVIPRKTWVSNAVYNQYDDTINLSTLLSDTENTKSMYVVNSENNVYKCINNNNAQISVYEPTGTAPTSEGNVLTADSYIWKYLYRVPAASPFATTNWIPVPTSSRLEYYTPQEDNAVDGELLNIVVENSGSGYYNTDIEVAPFPAACTVLTMLSPPTSQYVSSRDWNKVKIKMGLSGTGIQGYTYVTNIDSWERKIYLSYPTSSAGGGEGTYLNVFTRAEILGDGTGAVPNVILSDTSVQAVQLTKYGSSYNYVYVNVYGTGSGVVTRAILPPKYGHSFNAARELGTTNVMINMYYDDVDSIEILPSDITYRQYGIVIDPYKYGEDTSIITANTIVSQTTDVSVVPGPEYQKNEYVYQGNIDNPTFSGIVCQEFNNIVKLTNVTGILDTPSVLKSVNTNLTGRTTQKINKYPEFQPYTGYILYTKNIIPIQRSLSQIENIKLIVKF